MNKAAVEIKLTEADTQIKERITIQKSKHKKLEAGHPYFQKRIIWSLTKRADTTDFPYKAIEADESNGIRYQEIPIILLHHINGISVQQIQEKLTTSNCFHFEYEPAELDHLSLQEEYVFEEIKSITRPHSRAKEMASLTFINGQSTIDKEYERRTINCSKQGKVEIKLLPPQ